MSCACGYFQCRHPCTSYCNLTCQVDVVLTASERIPNSRFNCIQCHASFSPVCCELSVVCVNTRGYIVLKAHILQHYVLRVVTF